MSMQEIASGDFVSVNDIGLEETVVRVADTNVSFQLDEGDASGDDLSVASEEYEVDLEERLALLDNADREVTLQQKLAWWYAWVPSNTADFGEELGGSDMSLVSAEGLILRMAENLSFSSRFSETQQFLPLVFRIERLLSHLKECGIQALNLVFFDCFKPLLVWHHPGLWVFREFLYLHFQTTNVKFGVYKFSDWFTSEYTQFIARMEPFTYLMEDGGALQSPNSMFFPDEDADNAEADNEADSEDVSAQVTTKDGYNQFYLLYALALATLDQGISVAFLYRAKRTSRRFECFCLFPHPASSSFYNAIKDDVRGQIVGDRESTECLLAEFGQTPFSVDSVKQLHELTDGQVNIREALIIAALRETVSETDENSGEPADEGQTDVTTVFSKLTLLYCVVCRRLGLPERMNQVAMLKADDFADCSDLSFSIQFLFGNMLVFMEKLLLSAKQSPDVLEKFIGKTDAVDFFDGLLLKRLIVAVLQAVNDSTVVTANMLQLSDSMMKLLDSLWQFVKTDDSAQFFPIDLSGPLADENSFISMMKSRIPQLSETSGVASQEELPRLLPLEKNGYVEDFLERYLTKGSNLPSVTYPGCILPGSVSDEKRPQFELPPCVLQEGFIMGEFDEMEYHIESSERRKIDTLPPRLQNASHEEQQRYRRRGELRQQQKRQLFIRNLGKYFGGADSLHHPIVLLNGKASSDHPWLGTGIAPPVAVPEVVVPQITEESPKGKKEKEKEKVAATSPSHGKKGKVSNKAAQIIAKNDQAKALKAKQRDEEVYSSTISELLKQVFSTKALESPGKFNNTLLDLLVGTSRSTSTVDHFRGVSTFLRLRESQVATIVKLCESCCGVMTARFTKHLENKASSVPVILKTFRILFRIVHTAFNEYKDILDGPAIETLQRLLLILGFNKSAAALFEDWKKQQIEASKDEGAGEKKKANKKSGKGDTEADSKLAQKLDQYKVVSVSKKSDFALLPNTEARFQLWHLSEDFERTLGSASDPRVLFKPDEWQKKLLDVVDTRQSALVVAPTSSGKTFIGFYVMDKALRYDNESVVVFVSPTRALALQVEAEVNARFGKKSFPMNSNTYLVGHLFEARAENALRCQILVTLPNLLEGLLTCQNPEWQKRLKYVILDEIHCIGEDKIGQALENLIQLLPCPFLALSATVGNDTTFCNWLEKAKSENRFPQVKFIRHNERYAELETKYYSSQAKSLYILNPFMCTKFDQLKLFGFSGEFQLTALNSIEVYDLLVAVMENKVFKDAQHAQIFADLKNTLDPEEFFVGERTITKKSASKYSEMLKVKIVEAIRNNVVEESDYDLLLNKLTDRSPLTDGSTEAWYDTAKVPIKPDARKTKQLTALPTAESESKQSDGAAAAALEEGGIPATGITFRQALEMSSGAVSTSQMAEEFFTFMKTLQERELLPALVFNFNRATASRLFYRLAKKMIDGQRDKYYGTPEVAAQTRAINKQRHDQWKAQVANRDMAEKWKTLSKKEKEEQGINEAFLLESTGPLPPEPGDVADAFDPEFYFTDAKSFHAQQDDFKEVLQTTRLESVVSSFFIECLRRGMGLYHDSLHREYRRAVEYLFRMRYLRVVISDAALSVGINMPCKTSVFAGDNVLLTPLMYRQTSGRAGRRGYDNVGHIILWDFPSKKVRRLICSGLPMLSGKYPMSPTMTVKGVNLANRVLQSGRTSPLNKTEEIIKYQKLFSTPLFFVGACDRIREHLLKNISYLLRYNIDFLNRIAALDGSAQVTLLEPLIVGLAFGSPANLLLNYLIRVANLNLIENYSPEKKTLDIELEDMFAHIIALTYKRKEFHFSIVRRFELLSQLGASVNIKSGKPSSVFENATHPLLPPLPPRLEKPMRQIDQMALNTLVNSATALCSTLDVVDSEFRLPLTGLSFIPDKKSADDSAVPSFLQTQVSSSDFGCVSPFVALEKEGKRIVSTEDLLYKAREVVYVELGLMPTMFENCATIPISSTASRPDSSLLPRTTVTIPLVNSYACDVLRQKRLMNIIRDNDIQSSDAYLLIESFARFMNTSCSAFHRLLWKDDPKQGYPKPPTFVENDRLELTCRALEILSAKYESFYREIRKRV